MGLLTDPTVGHGKLTRILLFYHFKICIILYICGITWFCLLCLQHISSNTYFSENALLPGLVKSQFRDEKSTKQYYAELTDEMNKYEDAMPYPWLIAKMRQIGLDTYTHNFTLNYGLGTFKQFKGKNVYGILRAARSSSTEALVLSVPYRPHTSVYGKTAASIAVMFAFAASANKEKYWSKDIIFLITEHEQLGIQAWLEAYHNTSCGKRGVLDHGELKGRAGAIQAAINLELHDLNIAHIDIKIEGLNGQLPNLDLFNLANRMCEKEGIYRTFKNRTNRHLTEQLNEWIHSFETLLAMITTQATGVPNGNHGLFHRFGIEALTLEGHQLSNSRDSIQVGSVTVGRILEGIYRSLNNLLERFHQSFFFYVLPSTTSFISIGLYIPSICLITGILFIKACALWCFLQKNIPGKSEQSDAIKINENYEISDTICDKNINFISVGSVFILFHIVGISVMMCPNLLTALGVYYGFSTAHILSLGFTLISGILLLVPFIIPFKTCNETMTTLNILSLLELGTVLLCISVNNFSLAFILGLIYTPFVLVIKNTQSWFFSVLQKCLWLMVHPLVLLYIIITANTFSIFHNETVKENIIRGILATMEAISFSVVDSMIYGNWLYNVITAIFLPNWLCFWCVLFFRQKKNDTTVLCDKKKKQN